MTVVTASQLDPRLVALVDEVIETHEPVEITGDRGSAVLISKDDWESICETVYLRAIPGMAESIKEGMATPISEMSETLDW